MYKFVQFWIFVGRGDIEGGLEILSATTSQITAKIQQAGGAVKGAATKIFTGGLG